MRNESKLKRRLIITSCGLLFTAYVFKGYRKRREGEKILNPMPNTAFSYLVQLLRKSMKTTGNCCFFSNKFTCSKFIMKPHADFISIFFCIIYFHIITAIPFKLSSEMCILYHTLFKLLHLLVHDILK